MFCFISAIHWHEMCLSSIVSFFPHFPHTLFIYIYMHIYTCVYERHIYHYFWFSHYLLHQIPQVIIMQTLRSLAASEVVIMTILCVTSDNKIDIMTTLNFQCTFCLLGQFAIPETCKNWRGLVNSCIYYACQTHEISQVLSYSVDFKAPGELWNPLGKTVLIKCSFISNKGPVNIWKAWKAQKLVRRTCKYFS